MNYFRLIAALLFLPFFIQAQEMQLGLSGGVSLYQGDLQPSNDYSIEAVGKIGYSAGGFARFVHNPTWNTRLGLQYGYIEGSDALSSNVNRQARNLNFQTNLFELSLIEEINLSKFDPFKGYIVSPYLFLGVGVTYFNPKTEYMGELVALQPLGTEGQGMPGFEDKYSLLQLVIPFGGGIKMAVSNSATLNFEIGGRKTFTDYLDDVSGYYVSDRELAAGNGSLAAQLAYRTDEFNGDPNELATGEKLRGGPEYKDWYYFITVGIAFDIQADLLFGGTNRSGCPKW